jgi:hypothetical protein
MTATEENCTRCRLALLTGLVVIVLAISAVPS